MKFLLKIGTLLAALTAGPRGRKRLLFELTVLVAVLAAGGSLIALAGLVPIKASSGHWAITNWLLHFVMQRSVSTQALFVQPASLDAPGLVVKGAGHYEIGCRPCHGTPELRSPRVASKMTPHPPHLPDTVSKWKPEELFYIVKHGVKFTGMPAWPSQRRDDEVWAMVAFLMRFPNMSAQEYSRLAKGDFRDQGEAAPIQGLLGLEKLKAVHERCEPCHGADGSGRGPGSAPVLAGQNALYLDNALQAFARGERHSGNMEPIAAGLGADFIHVAANYYSQLAGLGSFSAQHPTTPDLSHGEAIAQRGIPSQRVPSCADCHGPGSTARNPAYPVLSGQDADYLFLQLTLFKEERRGGSAYAHLMQEVVAGLTAGQMRDVAQYYEWLGSR